jgi:uncharacterized protein (DUF1501 family)
MLDLIRPDSPPLKCDGSSRRDFLKVGALGLFGLTLPDLLRARAAETGRARKETSVILLFLDGGASHIDTFDPKMEAPAEYRCLFGAIPTTLPGVKFSSLLPKMAGRTDRLAVVRSFTHEDGDHGGATHWVKTGYPWPPEFRGKAPIIPQQRPSMGSVVARARRPIHPVTGVPTYVRVLSRHGGYPGDDAAWLGQDYSPFRCGRRGNTMLDNMALKVAPERLADRRSLLQSFDALDRHLDHSGVMTGMDIYQQQAVNVVLGRARQAFDLTREDVKTRERYGPGLGQELLLARRLCEAGAGFVTLNNGYWDHHGGIIRGCKELCPPLDHVVAAFLDDVSQRSLQDKILLVITGEFGRSPRVSGSGDGAGRDHWAGLNTLVLAGGGIKAGQVIGESDDKAAYPKARPIGPQDLMATLFQVLGVDLKTQYVHPSGRPISIIEEGQPIAELF